MLARYRSWTTDSRRWDGFRFRPGDIIISTPPKSGTTWVQTLCGLLIFGGPDFPAPLDEVSPWFDMANRPLDEAVRDLDAQHHRRFVKTHTPLDGIPFRDDVTYIVVGRDPRDVAISYHHHLVHMDFDRFVEDRAAAVGLDDLGELPQRPPRTADAAVSFCHFLTASDRAAPPPTVRNVMHHLETGWSLRARPNVGMFHYADMQADLAGQIEHLAALLDIELAPGSAAQLAGMAGLAGMRANAARLAPNVGDGYWKDPAVFFRSGRSGDWRDIIGRDEIAEYARVMPSLGSPDLVGWAHGGWIAPSRELGA